MTPLKRAEAAILRVAKERGVVMGIVAANHMAIEVITAIRESSEAMRGSGEYDDGAPARESRYITSKEAADVWQRMIDAALAEHG